MLYSEFIEGTGCKENDHNYKVYKDLEIMYMNSDLTKEEIYEYGKKLVDNNKTEEEIQFENDLRNRLADLRNQYKAAKEEVKRYREFYDRNRSDDYWKRQANWQREIAKNIKKEISGIKFILNSYNT